MWHAAHFSVTNQETNQIKFQTFQTRHIAQDKHISMRASLGILTILGKIQCNSCQFYHPMLHRQYIVVVSQNVLSCLPKQPF